MLFLKNIYPHMRKTKGIYKRLTLGLVLQSIFIFSFVLFYTFQIFYNEVHYINNLKVINIFTKVSERKRHKSSKTTLSFVFLLTFFLHLSLYSFSKHPPISAV